MPADPEGVLPQVFEKGGVMVLADVLLYLDFLQKVFLCSAGRRKPCSLRFLGPDRPERGYTCRNRPFFKTALLLNSFSRKKYGAKFYTRPPPPPPSPVGGRIKFLACGASKYTPPPPSPKKCLIPEKKWGEGGGGVYKGRKQGARFSSCRQRTPTYQVVWLNLRLFCSLAMSSSPLQSPTCSKLTNFIIEILNS